MPRIVRYLFYLFMVIVILQLSWHFFGPFGILIGLLLCLALGTWKIKKDNQFFDIIKNV